jgi:hypothetical protein
MKTYGEWIYRPKNTRYPLGKRLGVPKSRTERHIEVKILDTSGTQSSSSSVIQPTAYRLRHRAPTCIMSTYKFFNIHIVFAKNNKLQSEIRVRHVDNASLSGEEIRMGHTDVR